MKLKFPQVLSLSVLMVAIAGWADMPTITDVTARQRWPWNGKVDISYELEGDVAANVSSENMPKIRLTAIDEIAGTNYVADLTALSGDIGAEDGLHHVVWDLNAQGLRIRSDDVVFTVAYIEKPKPYCVVDISTGTNATSYPITYLTELPNGMDNMDEYKTTKLALRLIEPGEFMMDGQYKVTLTDSFYCGIFEVTQKQYELIIGENPSTYKGDMRPVESVSWNSIRGMSSTYNWPRSTDTDPNSFMGRLYLKTGLYFDLPTEAQWEYACRAGTMSMYNNGGDSEYDMRLLGRYSGNKYDGKGGYSGEHTTVGMYQPNAWGLYDMHGNVWEWCLDWKGDLSSGVVDPSGPYSGAHRIERGGSSGCTATDCSSSRRNYRPPSSELDYLGFRLVSAMSNMVSVRKLENVEEGTRRANVLCVGNSSPVKIDSRARAEPVVTSVSWDASWIGGEGTATVVITDNGIEVLRTSGTGEFSLGDVGRHELRYTTYSNGVPQDEVYTAIVFKDWKYEVVDGGVVITETTQTSGDVTIPSEIDGYPVTGVASGAFENCSGLTTVYIPQGYTGRTDVFPPATTVIRLRQIVTFDAKGGTVSPASNIVEYGASYGFLPEPSRIGYTFAGWQWNGQSILAETIVTALDNHTLFAQWITNKYSVVFDSNGGNGSMTNELDYASKIVVPEVTRSGYTFDGWQPVPLDMVPASNVTFHAQWTPCQYQVSFDATGGVLQNGQSIKTVIYDDAYGEMPEATRVGYTFAGWELYGQKVLPDTMVSTASNHTLTACWSANRYVVELNPNGGSLNPDDSTIEVVFDSEYGELPCPVRIGYSFTGWTASLIDADVIEPDSLATTNQILYALWEANPYQVVYEANNGSGETDRADAVYDEDVEIAANPFVWLGHVFVGWSTSADGEAVYEPGQIVRNLTSERDGEVTLYAIWEPLVVATPVITPGDGASFVGDTCLVTISCATDGADIYFSTRGTPPRIRESYRYSGAFEITDTTCVMAIALKENVTSEVAVVTISRRELTIPEAAGAMELTFETGGDADWVPIADVSAASGYSVRSGAIGCASYGTSNVTWLATEVGGAGTFSFRWKVDCEHGYTGMYLWDRFVVFTNDVEAAKIDGSQDWADVSLQFADSGRHSIRWLFLKDDEDDDGASFEDCAWVSGVKWTPAIVVADTEYDIGEMPESVAVQPGVTLSIKVESEPTESDIAALAERVTVSPKSSEQNAEYFKVVGNYDSAKESIALKVVIDEEAIGLAVTSQEVLDAVVDQAFSAGEVSLSSAKQGLYYGIVVVDDLSKMEAASVDVVFVKAGENGVRLTVPKPQGLSAFFKIVVSDVGNE